MLHWKEGEGTEIIESPGSDWVTLKDILKCMMRFSGQIRRLYKMVRLRLRAGLPARFSPTSSPDLDAASLFTKHSRNCPSNATLLGSVNERGRGH